MLLYVDAFVCCKEIQVFRNKCKLEGGMLMPCIEEICKDMCQQWQPASKIALILPLQLF